MNYCNISNTVMGVTYLGFLVYEVLWEMKDTKFECIDAQRTNQATKLTNHNRLNKILSLGRGQ